MKYVYVFILSIGISCSSLFAQSLERQVLSAIGGQVQNAQREVSFTGGQVGSQNYVGSIILTQGFQQANESSSVGIDRELQQVLDYKIYPNPVRGPLTLELNSDRELKVSYSLVDAQGKLLLRSPDNMRIIPNQNMRKELDLKTLATGIYFLVLSNEQGQTIRSFPIKKL